MVQQVKSLSADIHLTILLRLQVMNKKWIATDQKNHKKLENLWIKFLFRIKTQTF